MTTTSSTSQPARTGQGNPPLRYSIDEVARTYNVHPRTVRVWIYRGDLPAIKIGSRVYVRPEDIAVMERGAEQRMRAVTKGSPCRKPKMEVAGG